MTGKKTVQLQLLKRMFRQCFGDTGRWSRSGIGNNGYLC